MDAELVVEYIGKYARIQGLIEIAIQMKIRSDSEIQQGLGDDYFERLSDAQRVKWLKVLLTPFVYQTICDRIQTSYFKTKQIRDTLVHRPPNLQFDSSESPKGVSKHATKPESTSDELAKGILILDWITEWVTWTIFKYSKFFRKFDGIEWVDYEPEMPAEFPPK